MEQFATMGRCNFLGMCWMSAGFLIWVLWVVGSHGVSILQTATLFGRDLTGVWPMLTGFLNF